MSNFDPHGIGLKVGLEIHQQLATKTKLFCACPTTGAQDYEYSFVRRLRPTQSELGQLDQAALFEFKKGMVIKYHASRGNTCLVEEDEEPPHELAPEAVEAAVVISLALSSQTVDELHTMRKIVIDGSNTTGFQRTVIVALGGVLETPVGNLPVQTVTLEEDAARLMGESDGVREYGLERLGIPLVEVALAPMTASTRDIQEIALTLGRLMRATKRVARGLGTIRQDLNISIEGGGLVEVKGVQKLDLLGKIIDYEALRQIGLLKVRDMLKERGLSKTSIKSEFADVSQLFQNTASKVLSNALGNEQQVMGVALPGFKGLVGYEPYPNVRLGKEFADLVRFYGLGGLFHSDELPKYGISEEEIEAVRKELKLRDDDAFVILAGPAEIVQQASQAVVARATQALKGVPSETRAPVADGTTRYSRPRPGAARMYPETDIPSTPISDDFLKRLSDRVPKSWEEQVKEIHQEYGLSVKLAEQIFDSDHFDLFRKIAKNTKIQASFVAATLSETLVSLSREGLDVDRLRDDSLAGLFGAIDQGRISKEAVPEVLAIFLKGDASSMEDAISKSGLKAVSDAELIKMIDTILEGNEAVVNEKGERAFSTLMGKVMISVRGRVDGGKVSSLLKERLKKRLV